MRMVVDFPAPLGPRNPTTWPRSTANETWSTAVTPSNRLETPSTERRGIQSRERVYRRSDANHIGPPSSSPPGPRRGALNRSRTPEGSPPCRSIACSGVVASISSRRRLFQLPGRTLDHVRRGLERLAGGLDLRVALGPVFLLDRLAHAWKCFHAVARVEAGRIDRVTIPRPAWQSGRGRQCALRAEQGGVHGLRVRLGQGRAAIGLGAPQGFLVAFRRARQRVGRVVERREVEKRRKSFPCRGHVGLARIGGGREPALVELAVPLADPVPPVLP